jgi:hypothetical protein
MNLWQDGVRIKLKGANLPDFVPPQIRHRTFLRI